MTRKSEWYVGAIYHVTVRGNRRNDIFKDNKRSVVLLYTI